MARVAMPDAAMAAAIGTAVTVPARPTSSAAAALIRLVPQGRRVLVSLRRADLEARFSGLLDTILRSYQQSITKGRRYIR